jgi:hypothetical protein
LSIYDHRLVLPLTRDQATHAEWVAKERRRIWREKGVANPRVFKPEEEGDEAVRSEKGDVLGARGEEWVHAHFGGEWVPLNRLGTNADQKKYDILFRAAALGSSITVEVKNRAYPGFPWNLGMAPFCNYDPKTDKATPLEADIGIMCCEVPASGRWGRSASRETDPLKLCMVGWTFREDFLREKKPWNVGNGNMLAMPDDRLFWPEAFPFPRLKPGPS